MRQWRHPVALGLFALLVAAPALAQATGSTGPRPLEGRGAGAGPSADLAVVARFDTTGKGWLDAEERARARAWLLAYRGTESVGGGGGGAYNPTGQGRMLTPDDVLRLPGAPVYDPGVYRTIFLQFENDDWEAELAAFYNTDVEVPAAVSVDGRTYDDVGVRFRGATSFRGVPEGSKRSLRLGFDWRVDGQGVEGVRTFNLLNAAHDPTFLRTVLYSEIAREYIPTPRVNFVRVVVNGESWGVYVNQQQFNKDFLVDFYDTDEGVRWKVPGSQSGQGLAFLGEDPAAYRRHYEIRSRDEPERWADLIHLTRVLDETSPEHLEAALAPLLDIEGALRFLALEMALASSDGYWARGSDFTLYQSPEGRFHLVPHDFNEAFGAHGHGELDPLIGLMDTSKPLRSKLLAVPALRGRYLALVREIAEHWLDWSVLGPRVEVHRALIEEEVRLDTRKHYGDGAFEAGLEELRRWVEARRSYLLGNSGGF